MKYILSLGAASIVAAACNRQPTVVVQAPPPTPTPLPVARTETFETRALAREIDKYQQDPSQAQSARVAQAFAEIDGEIAELSELVAKRDGEARAEAARKLANLRAYRDGEKTRFAALEVKAAPAPEPRVSTPRGEGTGEKIGEKIDEAAGKVEDKIRDAADAIRDKTR